MNYAYEPYGPFQVPLDQHRQINSHGIRGRGNFWSMIDELSVGLSTARGCYVFSIRAGRGIRPWYVGQASGEKGFKQEVFQSHKLVHMNGVMARIKRGTPIIHLLPRITPTGRFSKNVQQAELDYLETLLIGLALTQNHKLCNVQTAKLLQKVVVPGVTKGGGSGRLKESRATLKIALGL